jgi:hypothetical protein
MGAAIFLGLVLIALALVGFLVYEMIVGLVKLARLAVRR